MKVPTQFYLARNLPQCLSLLLASLLNLSQCLKSTIIPITLKKFSFVQVTFFDGEIISEKHPFLTRKWDADEDVDKKHWVGLSLFIIVILKFDVHVNADKQYWAIWGKNKKQRIFNTKQFAQMKTFKCNSKYDLGKKSQTLTLFIGGSDQLKRRSHYTILLEIL